MKNLGKVYIDRKELIDKIFSMPYDVLSTGGGGFSRKKLIEIINNISSVEKEVDNSETQRP